MPILLVLLSACEPEPVEPEWPTDDRDSGADTAADDTGGPGPDPRPTTVAFTGYAATVVDAPFGLTSDELREAPCEGTFTYDLAVVDREPDDGEYGEYDHGDRRTAAFELRIAGHTVTGSGAPITEVHDRASGDLWRWSDGPQLGDDTNRTLSVDDVPERDATLWVSLALPAATFAGDAQPEPFPTLTVNSIDHPHTFSLDVPGGSVLLQLYTIAPG